MATTQTTQTAQTTHQTSSQFTYVMRIVYMVILWAFIAGLLLQFFFAGLSIFVGPTCWETHVAFGRGFVVTTALLVLLALAGRLPRRQIVMTAIFILLHVLQILLIELPGRLGAFAVSALHPVNAAVMLGLAIVLARRAWKITRGDKSNYRER
jgi:cytochrome bd-type quinol oxidase subunit 1